MSIAPPPVTGSTPRREEPREEEEAPPSEEEDEEEENFYDDDDDDDFDDSESDSDDDGDRPGELTVTTAGGVRVVLARSSALADDDEEEEEAERAARGRRRRRRLEEEQRGQAGAAASSDPETAAAAAASAARLAHELSLRCTPAGPRGSPALREMMLRMCGGGGGGDAGREQGQEEGSGRQQQRPPARGASPRSAALPPSPPTPPPLAAASATLSTAAILRARERGAAGRGASSSSAAAAGLSAAARAYLTAKAFAPVAVAGLGDDPRPSRAYVGFYTDSGDLYLGGYQNDRRIRVYECGPEGLGLPCSSASGSGSGGGGDAVGECGWRLVKDISCRLLRWTVTDALCVPGPGGSEAKLLYSTISPTVHCVNLSSSSLDDDDDGGGGGSTRNGRGNGRRGSSSRRRGRVTSIANTTDVHEPLNFDEMLGAPPDEVLPGFGIWSIKWNPGSSGGGGGGGGGGAGGGNTVLAGASDGCCYLFDAEVGKTVARYARAHDDDVNAVVYLAAGPGSGGGGSGGGRSPCSSPDVFASGSDDGLIKVWDSRVPSGALTGSSVAGNSFVAFHAVARPVGVLVGHGAGEWSFFLSFFCVCAGGGQKKNDSFPLRSLTSPRSCPPPLSQA